ncbi:DNA-binding LytR/AlgR family response regulator [Catalinimonas alkaloidigena]|uniref:LytR/AlgR family response regulator transcription factor n=1 Tax=Catalinimonas TaxID=1522128 RepID=UPI0024052E6F|nr:LytTR family DNA-binding domain-containing protein [Catalinimonas alkaloidigena]MDF9799076.1 DNA-binding LytR/AlgR family response regulator [Catalinimonas alkaloidigena]
MERILRAIAVDDNPAALITIQSYAKKIDWLYLDQCFTEALPGVSYLKNHPVDVVLLDIEMDDISGLDFINIVKDKGISHPQFVIISAHEQYALKGFELNVVDYLHKPISYNRFVHALERVNDRLSLTRNQKEDNIPTSNNHGHPFSDYLFIHHHKKLIKILKDNITYIQSDGHYCYLYLTDQSRKHISYSLADMEKLLLESSFLRVHKSFLVNVRHIHEIDSRSEASNLLLDDGEEIPIGITYRPLVQQLCRNLSGF